MQFDHDALVAYYANAPQDIALADIDLARVPQSIAVIMDGNGRWAQARGLARGEGHIAGIDALRETITTCVRLGVDVLYAYAFSTENWKRPQAEVDLLMHLFAVTLVEELPLFHQENVRLVFMGDLEELPQETQEVFEHGLQETAGNTGMVLALAVNYGARAELARAARLLAQEVAAGDRNLASIDEKTLGQHLYSHGLKDPDLLVRTSGELRLSNFMLYQLAYSEMYATPTLWPDFDRWELLRAIRTYQGRDRRFGGVKA